MHVRCEPPVKFLNQKQSHESYGTQFLTLSHVAAISIVSAIHPSEPIIKRFKSGPTDVFGTFSVSTISPVRSTNSSPKKCLLHCHTSLIQFQRHELQEKHQLSLHY